jgi:zinc transporter ZupT
LIAFVAVEQISSLLPLSFAFAAGAMLALIALEMLPQAFSGPGRRGPSIGLACGAALMLILSFLLAV